MRWRAEEGERAARSARTTSATGRERRNQHEHHRHTVDNGVNVEALLGARAAFTEAPEMAQFTWRSSVTWENGTHSRSEVESFYGFADEQVHHTSFTLDADHPLQFAAQDKGPTPTEYVLVGLGACLTAGVAAVAQQREIQLRSVKATLSADMDLQGILGRPRDPQGLQRDQGRLPDRCRRFRRRHPGPRGAVPEAVRRLRHRDQPDRRHRQRDVRVA